MTLRVLIAGGGLGGLTLAHGLRAAGLQPLVFERGPAQADLSASYRIHIDADGSRALYACLPPAQWRAFERHAAAPPRGLAFATERLERLAFITEPDPAREPVAHAHPISRAGLRQLLLSGLEDVVTFDTPVTGFERPSDAEVIAHLADGRSVRGDVLVGADGSGSAVRKQLLPSARVTDSGVTGIGGKVFLDARACEWLTPRMLHEMTMVLPRDGLALFVAPFIRPLDRMEPASAFDLPEHVFWAMIGHPAAFGPGPRLRQRAPADLQQVAAERVRGWHPLLQRLVAEADASSVIGVPLQTSVPVAAWPTSRVTLLGDAIHTMTPLQGLGGNTALRDAALLCRQLVEVERGRAELLPALAAYESAMRHYGFTAVQRSLQVSNAVADTNRVGRQAFRVVLRAADRVPWLHHRLFQRSEATAA